MRPVRVLFLLWLLLPVSSRCLSYLPRKDKEGTEMRQFRGPVRQRNVEMRRWLRHSPAFKDLTIYKQQHTHKKVTRKNEIRAGLLMWEPREVAVSRIYFSNKNGLKDSEHRSLLRTLVYLSCVWNVFMDSPENLMPSTVIIQFSQEVHSEFLHLLLFKFEHLWNHLGLEYICFQACIYRLDPVYTYIHWYCHWKDQMPRDFPWLYVPSGHGIRWLEENGHSSSSHGYPRLRKLPKTAVPWKSLCPPTMSSGCRTEHLSSDSSKMLQTLSDYQPSSEPSRCSPSPSNIHDLLGHYLKSECPKHSLHFLIALLF